MQPFKNSFQKENLLYEIVCNFVLYMIKKISWQDMHNSLFFLEKKSEIWNAFTLFEKWKVNFVFLSLFSRMKSEMKIHWDREWKVKWKCLEIEKWNFKTKKNREKRLLQVTAVAAFFSFCLHLWASLGTDKLDQPLQSLLGEVLHPLEQALPHLLVTDQAMQTAIGLATVEKGFWLHGKENGKNLAVREALQPRQVVPIESADVGLENISSQERQTNLWFGKFN